MFTAERHVVSDFAARKIVFVAHLILVKGEVKYADNFDCTFDARQRGVRYVFALTKPLSCVKGEVKCANNFDLTFGPRQSQSQICNSFATPLIVVKSEVKKKLIALTSHLTPVKEEVKYATDGYL